MQLRWSGVQLRYGGVQILLPIFHCEYAWRNSLASLAVSIGCCGPFLLIDKVESISHVGSLCRRKWLVSLD